MAITVDTLVDEADGSIDDGDISLRDALALAEPDETIDFAPALTAEGPATILLTLGELLIDKSLTIVGPGAELLAIDASGNDPTPDENNGDGSRVFSIDDGEDEQLIDVLLSGLTLTGGDAMGGGGGIRSFENLTIAATTVSRNANTTAELNPESPGGGGIYNSHGALAIANSSITNNLAIGVSGGGGIYSTRGDLTIINSTISSNTGQSAGGGIYIQNFEPDLEFVATVNISSSTISSNSGSGIFCAGAYLTISDCAITHNSTSGQGGGIFTGYRGELTLIESTVASNSSMSDGGGILSGTKCTIIESAVTGNTSMFRGGGVFFYSGGGSVIDSMISGNVAQWRGGGVSAHYASPVSISGCTITSNSTDGIGGGVDNAGNVLTVTESTINENTARQGGGIARAFYFFPIGVLMVTDSTVSGNTATERGGGVYTAYDPTLLGTGAATEFDGYGAGEIPNLRGKTMIVGSTIEGNTAASGGGIWTNDGDVRVSNSTISGNTAETSGGGLYWLPFENPSIPVPLASIQHSTIALNSAGEMSGGLFAGPGSLALTHTIVATNMAPSRHDFGHDAGTIVESRFSLIGHNDGSVLVESPIGMPDTDGNLIGGPVGGAIDPRLAPLGNYGGPTRTHALLAGSPAIDAGDPTALAGVGGLPEFDQRGAPFGRVMDGDDIDSQEVPVRIDIGAYERTSAEDFRFVVDTLVDELDADHSAGDFSLREAIELAELNPGADVIEFASALTAEGPATIVLTLGELAIASSLRVQGPGAEMLTIDASGNDPTPDEKLGDGSRVFLVDDGNEVANLSVSIVGLTLTGGDMGGDGGGAILARENFSITGSRITGNASIGEPSEGGNNSSSGSGGAIVGVGGGFMAVVESVVENNWASSYGGGVFIQGGNLSVVASKLNDNMARSGGAIAGRLAQNIVVISSTVSNNNSTLDGPGGIRADRGNLSVIDSTVSGNSGGIGGLYIVDGDLTVTSSTITGNDGMVGGGIHIRRGMVNPGLGSIASSTISGNTAREGAGIFSDAILTVAHSTITLNEAAELGGGILLTGANGFLNYSIVAGNTQGGAAGDVHGHVTIGYTLLGVDTGTSIVNIAGNQIGTAEEPLDPLLGPLGHHGGPTRTHGLLAGSPALDAGNPAAVPGVDVPEFDQRGVPWMRIAGERIDLGAFESQSNPLPGDYNLSGAVDAADYAVWRMTKDTSVPPFTGADGDGNGVVDQADYDIWRAHFGVTLVAGSGGQGTGHSNLRAVDAEPQASTEHQAIQQWQGHGLRSTAGQASSGTRNHVAAADVGFRIQQRAFGLLAVVDENVQPRSGGIGSHESVQVDDEGDARDAAFAAWVSGGIEVELAKGGVSLRLGEHE